MIEKGSKWKSKRDREGDANTKIQEERHTEIARKKFNANKSDKDKPYRV